jgi:hypothetical protein
MTESPVSAVWVRAVREPSGTQRAGDQAQINVPPHREATGSHAAMMTSPGRKSNISDRFNMFYERNGAGELGNR